MTFLFLIYGFFIIVYQTGFTSGQRNEVFLMRKFSLDLKVEIYNEYKKGRALQELSKEYEMNFSNLRYMVKFIDKYGIEEYIKPNHYSDELKLYLIQRVINNEDTIFNEVDSYTTSHRTLEKENQKYKKEVSKLETENKELRDENRSLIYRLNELFQLLKKFLRKLLQRGNDYTKDETAEVVKDCYDNSEFDMGDVIKISRGTTKQDELFEYTKAPDYYKERIKDYNNENEKNKRNN